LFGFIEDLMMGYYVRVFCKAEKVPSVKDILGWLKGRGCRYSIEINTPEVDRDSCEWKQLSLEYKEGKLPILVECWRDDGTESCAMHGEIDEFLESVGKAGLSLAKRRVVKHLKGTRFTIACQLPVSDIDDDGYDANGEFLRYFLENCEGMIQADGEGFYEGERLIVKIR